MEKISTEKKLWFALDILHFVIYCILCHNLSPFFLRANVPVTMPIINEIRETTALKINSLGTTIW